MLSEQQQRIMGYFIEEAKDHLNTIEQALLSLQTTIADPEMASELFRAAHSVKGGAAMLGLESIQHTSHRLEDYFKILKECPIQVDQRLETLLLNVFDTLKDLLDQLQGPFGLTDDKSAEAMRNVEPTFIELNAHMSHLVEQSGNVPPEDVNLTAIPSPVTVVAQPIAVASSADTTTEESAFQLIFQSDVPARLRDMLRLFKQAETSDARQQLQDVCQSLVQAGEQFELVPWVDLLDLARRAIAHTDNDFRSLASVIIREIKQAQEQVLSGQSMAIAPSDSLLALVPVDSTPLLDELDSFDFLSDDDDAEMGSLDLIETDLGLDSSLDLGFNDLLSSEETDDSAFEDFFADADTDASNLDLGAADTSLPHRTLSQEFSTDETLDDLSLPANFSTSSPSSEASDDDGPAVGAAELNSLADLFETDAPELSINWQNEEVLRESDHGMPEPLDADLSSDFSDLLQAGLGDLVAPLPDSDESLSELLRQSEQSQAQADSELDSLLNTGLEDDSDDADFASLLAIDGASAAHPDAVDLSDLDLDLGDDLFGDTAIAPPVAEEPQDDSLIGELGNFFSDVADDALDSSLLGEKTDDAEELSFLLEEDSASADPFADLASLDFSAPGEDDNDAMADLLGLGLAPESAPAEPADAAPEEPFDLGELDLGLEEDSSVSPNEPFGLGDLDLDFAEAAPAGSAESFDLGDLGLDEEPSAEMDEPFDFEDLDLDLGEERSFESDQPSDLGAMGLGEASSAGFDASFDLGDMDLALDDPATPAASGLEELDSLSDNMLGLENLEAFDVELPQEELLDEPTGESSSESLDAESAFSFEADLGSETSGDFEDFAGALMEEDTSEAGLEELEVEELEPDNTPRSWLDALDSEDGLEDLPAAPAQWDPTPTDVTSDLWADTEAAQAFGSFGSFEAASPAASVVEPDAAAFDALSDEPFDLSPPAPVSEEPADGSGEEAIAMEPSLDFNNLDLQLESPADLPEDSLAGLDLDLDLENVDLDSFELPSEAGAGEGISLDAEFDDINGLSDEPTPSLSYNFLESEPSTVMTDVGLSPFSEMDEADLDPFGFEPATTGTEEAGDLDLQELLGQDDGSADADLDALLGNNFSETGDLGDLLGLDDPGQAGPESLGDDDLLDLNDEFSFENLADAAVSSTDGAMTAAAEDALAELDLDMFEDQSDSTASTGDADDLAELDLDMFGDQADSMASTGDVDDLAELDLDMFGDRADVTGATGAEVDITEGNLAELDLDMFGDQAEVAIAPDTNAGGDDFSDLDALLDQAEDDSGFSESLTDADAGDDFADLDALLDEPGEPSSPMADENGGTGDDDFADLEALLTPELPSTPPPPSPPPTGGLESLDGSPGDEFDDLERLLEAADSALGGSPTVRGVRSPATANRRPTRTSGMRSDQTMRVSVKNLDNLNNLIGELVVNRNSLEQAEERLRQFLDNLQYQVQQLSDVGQRMRDLYERSLLESSLMSSRKSYQMAQSNPQASAAAGGHATGMSFDALEMDRFTGFHTLSQEMIELIVRVRESASDIDFVVGETDQVTRNFRQITSQLQESLTRARMVPFAQTADRLPRAVRDISLRCGKQAELTIEGRETLIDKMILEQLYDPMTHLVNNAITHGIETPNERASQGKGATGRITVRAFHQGNQTVISVSDDGAGIDPDRVKQKAVERGLITKEQAGMMSRLDVYDLLFHHGFSTRDRADDFAGRGVGMDVVRTSLNDIRGVINIDSTIGRGTTFTIRLPLTLSVSKALCCISNRARIAFPMDGVEDMLDVPREQIQTNELGESCIQWRDQLLPFQSLSDLLKFNRSLGRGSVYGGNQEEDIVSVVVLRSNAGSYLALQVDQVLGEQEIVIKQLEGPVPKPVGIAGATVLGDGRIMPIADVLELIDLSEGRIRREAGSSLWEKTPDQIPADPEPDFKTEPTVLIVDDSITVRELLSMTFSKVGYRVEQARDGQEAWEKLRSGLPCDLVFCDIEMPRMDGLELLSRLQKDPQLNLIPIAMLTSRGADRHRQMAVTLGAKGYFTKPYLEEVLLDAAQRMLTGEVLVEGAAEGNGK